MEITKEKLRALKEASWADNILWWLEDNHILTEKGLPIEFHNHPFLKDIYEDWTPRQVSRKASQIGYTIMKAIKTLYAAKYKNWNIIYTFPTFGDVGQIIPSKLNLE